MEIGDQREAENRRGGEFFTFPSQHEHGVSGPSNAFCGKISLFSEGPTYTSRGVSPFITLPGYVSTGCFRNVRNESGGMGKSGDMSDRYPPSRLSTGEKRLRTTDKDSESDKGEIVDSYPKMPMLFGPSAAPNKTATSNGEASYDQSSNQATHGDSDPNNTCISVDNLGTNDVPYEHDVSGYNYWRKTNAFDQPTSLNPFFKFFPSQPMADGVTLPSQPEHGVSRPWNTFCGKTYGFGETPTWTSSGQSTISSDVGVSPFNTLPGHVSTGCFRNVRNESGGMGKSGDMSDRYPPSRFSTGEKRFRTTDKDSESDKSEIVDSYPKRPMLFGPSAAPNKKTTSNGEASYDQNSNQATHGDSDPNNTCISVDNLGTNDVTDEHLRQIFTPYGKLAVVGIIAGTQSGFVQFISRSSAEEAIRNLNGTELAGQNLRLSFANKQVRNKAIETEGTLPPDWPIALPPVSDRDLPPALFSKYKTVETGASYQATHSGDRDPKIQNNTSILVDNLVPNVATEEQLREIFTQYGEVGYVKIMVGTQFGFVGFVSRSCAEEAIRNLNGKELAGQNLKLSFSNKKERGAEYLDNGLPYGWSGSGIFRGLPPFVSDSGLPIELTGGWFSAPSPFMCEKVVDPADPRIAPTHEDVESDEAIWALYKRWCRLNKVHRTPEEMQMRLGFFKKNAIQAYEANRDRPLGRYVLYIWADDPSKEPRPGMAG